MTCRHGRKECRKCGLVLVSQSERDAELYVSRDGAALGWCHEEVPTSKPTKTHRHTTIGGRGVVARIGRGR